jgi:hypothetical protein
MAEPNQLILVQEFSIAEQVKKMRDETEQFTRTENFVRFGKVTNKGGGSVGSVHYTITSGGGDDNHPNVLLLTPPPDTLLVRRLCWFLCLYSVSILSG